MFYTIIRAKNKVLTSLLGYEDYFTLKHILDRRLYKKSVIALSIDGGNFRLPLGEGKRIKVWGISNSCEPFPYYLEDMELTTENKNVARVNGNDVVFGKRVGTTRLLVRSLSNPCLEATCEIDVID